MDASIFSVNPDDAGYPPLLKESASAPAPLFYRGVLPPEGFPLLAIVGTRKATSEGVLLAKKVARECAERGFGIVSGLALGIDAAAHTGALSGEGYTLAVLANGLDTIYPREHNALGERILESGGGMVSEYPKGTPALPHQFLERNRIIAAISVATVVIEAPERSGAIATARNAAEEGREVFVFPGPANHPNYRGSHALIRKGARLVNSAADIFEDLGVKPKIEAQENLFSSSGSSEKPLKGPAENEAQDRILETLRESKKILSIDNLSQLTKLEPKIITRELAFLMLQGSVEEWRGGFRIKR